MNIHPEITPTIMGHEPLKADDVLDTAAWVDMKDCAGLLITVMHLRAADTDYTVDVHEGDTASGTTQVADNVEIWAALDALNDPTMVRQTDAKSYTIDTGVYTGTQIVQMYVCAAGRKRYIQCGSSGGNAGNLVSILYQKDGARYKGDESY